MRIRYETGIAALVQFVVTTLLTFVSGVDSVVGSCRQGFNADCVSNAFVSLVLIILIVFALGCLLLLGYAAQERRSSFLAKLLLAAEVGIAFIYLFDTKQAPDLIERITNLLSFSLAAWVALVAWRLARSNGGRIVKGRRHQRGTKQP